MASERLGAAGTLYYVFQYIDASDDLTREEKSTDYWRRSLYALHNAQLTSIHLLNGGQLPCTLMHQMA